MPAQERKTVTTSVRMTAEQRDLIKKAAASDNRTVNNFLVTAALREAQAILAKADDGR
jgi:uncharacterized protein (DUF1778 family)